MNFTNIVRYCADEVIRQGDGPIHVAHMFSAWEYLTVVTERELIDQDIRIVGAKVNGVSGLLTWRRMPATFNQGSPALAPEHIERQMTLLLLNQNDTTVDGFVHRFLEIHPFHDGNGRVASLIYNWMRGTLLAPLPLPEYSFV